MNVYVLLKFNNTLRFWTSSVLGPDDSSDLRSDFLRVEGFYADVHNIFIHWFPFGFRIQKKSSIMTGLIWIPGCPNL